LVALLGVAVVPACHLLGDHFFFAEGRVVECGTTTPIRGVTVSGHLDKDDDGNAPRDLLEDTDVTDASGEFLFATAVEPEALITLTFEHAGFTSVVTQLEGTPDGPLEVCMMRETAN
jgi:hypothetical protein